MKKIAYIFLITIYLYSATDLKELLKINVVVQHLYETQKTDSSVSLFKFLVMHYVTDDQNDKDNERDKQLPFKSTDSCFSNISFVSIAYLISTTNFQTFSVDAYGFLATYDSGEITSFNSIVWHPPQFS